MKPTDKKKSSPHGVVTPNSGKASVPDSLPAEAMAAESAAESSGEIAAEADAVHAQPAEPESATPKVQDDAKPHAMEESVIAPKVQDKATDTKGASSAADTPKATNTPKATEAPKVKEGPKGSAATDPASKSTAGGAMPPPTPPKEHTPPRSGSGSGGGKALSSLALLVALAALGLSGWQLYQGQADVEADDGAAVEARFEELSAAQQESVQQAVQQSRRLIEERLEDVPQSSDVEQVRRMAVDLQRRQQATSQQLEALQGEARSDWKLAEAEYLLRLASLRLLAAQDVRSAKELLDAVDQILRDEPDSGVFAVREQLAQYRARLQGLPEVDRPGIYMRLAALREEVNRIVALPMAVFDPDEVEAESEEQMAQRSRMDAVLMRLERYVRVDFQRGKVITPQLDEAEMHRIRRTLQLAIEQAQWAALRGEQEIYRQSLEQTEDVLRQFFDAENPQVRALQSQLNELAEREIELSPPDVAPLQQGLAAYIQSRRNNGAGNGNVSGNGNGNGNGSTGAADAGAEETGNE